MRDSTEGDMTKSTRRDLDRLKEAAIELYRQGYSQAEVLRNKERLAEIHRLGSAWKSLTQSSLTRWIKAAREDDFDLGVWHLLGSRRFKPDIYTNWRPQGKIIIAPFYDEITDTRYSGVWNKPPPAPKWKMPLSDAAGPYVAQLRSLGYSIREIQKLWDGKGTKNQKLDQSPQVQLLVRQLRVIRKTAMSHTTISRILHVYSFGPMGQDGRQNEPANLDFCT
jgi:hypothetical protein